MPRALISVSDKRGIVEFGRALVGLGWEIVSTGGTAAALRKAGIPVTPVEEVTGFPEILDGRVKTLHPAIHGGLLGRRDHPTHRMAMEAHGIEPFDLVAVNLYPFQETIATSGVTFDDAIENIDIGGPSMLRSAAKNHEHVVPVVDPRDYTTILTAIREDTLTSACRRALAAKVFTHTADYDSAISSYLTEPTDGLPRQMNLALEQMRPLRYGENPGQSAAFYVERAGLGLGALKQHGGKELSFNNLLDLEGAMLAIDPFGEEIACAIIKHTTPCGIALGRTATDAFQRALATDPVSAFGSVIAFNTVVDRATAEALGDLFVEVVVAPSVNEEALGVFAARKNLRVVELPVGSGAGTRDWKRVRGGFLIQDRFQFDPSEAEWTVPTARRPTDEELDNLRFAWAAVAPVKSNAILLARDEMAIGIGAGQMSRVDAVFLAIHKARQQGHDLAGAALASDAFFPFADGLEQAAEAGITAVIQPGGSVRDAEVIAAADARGIAMVFTGKRMFRH
ncbi:MAG: bifunctional phosphoribosylaminoimidazolecarboxamide formyltransferase/IMP cyclohydrolase [Gemmatimonadales bacterium]